MTDDVADSLSEALLLADIDLGIIVEVKKKTGHLTKRRVEL